MPERRRQVSARFLGMLGLACFLAGLAGLYLAGSELLRPAPARIGPPPRGLRAETVAFRGSSGSLLQGWFARREAGSGVVILMHGIRSNRTSMLSRARFLTASGYSVLMFDFQGHGESEGSRQTFGWLESFDARAALAFVRQRMPAERAGAIGVSLGGAAALLGGEPMDLDALILEAVYPTIEEATANRIAERLGASGRLLAPLLTMQLRPRLGVSPADLRPITAIRQVRSPILLMAGEKDLLTTPAESARLLAAAPRGLARQYWEVPGAGHTDFHAVARGRYEAVVLRFLQEHLRVARD